MDGSYVREELAAIISAARKVDDVSPGRSNLQKRKNKVFLLQYLADRRDSFEVAPFGVRSFCMFVL